MPSNDNFANAQAITGQSGAETGDTTGASSETGEPSNYGKTIWYKWTCPATGRYFFMTFGSAIRTTLGIYTGTTVSGLTPVAFNERYAGWRDQSFVNFVAMHGTEYHIRIDGVSGAQGATLLTWGRFYGLKFGNCGDCCQKDDAGNVHLATVAVTPPSSTLTLATSEATFPGGPYLNGAYMVRYCGGAFCEGNTTGTQWVAIKPPQWYTDYIYNTTTAIIDWFCRVKYVALGGGTADMDFDSARPVSATTVSGGTITPYPGASPGAGEDYDSQQAVEYEERCAKACFWHDGGDIKIKFQEWDSADEVGGSPWPTFKLYSIPNAVKILTVVGDMYDHTTSPHTYKIILSLRSVFCADLPGCTVTLRTGGGVINPSAPVTGVTIPASGSEAVTFQYQTSPGNTNFGVTATIGIELADGSTLPDQTIDLSPIITLFRIDIFSNFNCASGPQAIRRGIRVQNTGYGVVDNLILRVASGTNVTDQVTTALCTVQSSPVDYQSQMSGSSANWCASIGLGHDSGIDIRFHESASPASFTITPIDTGPSTPQTYPPLAIST